MDKILGPPEKPPSPPKPKPKPEPKPAAKAAKPKKITRQEQIKAEVDALRAEVFGANPRRAEVESKLKAIKAEEARALAELARLPDSHPRAKELDARLKVLSKERIPLADEWLGFRDAAPDRRKIDAYLFQPQLARPKFTTSVDGTLGAIEPKYIKPGLEWIKKVVSREDAESFAPGTRTAKSAGKYKIYLKIEVNDVARHHDPSIRQEYRNRAFQQGGRIWLPRTLSKHSTFVHEFGHVLDDNSPLRGENGVRFREHRTKGEQKVRLKDLFPRSGYGMNEWTRPDKFKSPYCGKEYGDRRSSEITSMGLQFLFEDPVEFLRDDPEYFAFMIHQLRGVAWSAP